MGPLVQRDAIDPHPRRTSEEREALQKLIRIALFSERSYPFIMNTVAGVSVWKMSEWMMGGREQRTGASGSAAYTRGLLSEREAWQGKSTENGTARQSGWFAPTANYIQKAKSPVYDLGWHFRNIDVQQIREILLGYFPGPLQPKKGRLMANGSTAEQTRSFVVTALGKSRKAPSGEHSPCDKCLPLSNHNEGTMPPHLTSA